MTTPPDPVSLDAILTGADDAADSWERLVSSAAAQEAWDDAVERRRALNELTDLLITYPAIATIRRAARKAVNDVMRLPTLALLRDGLPAHLGPGQAVLVRRIPLNWGEVDVVGAALGDTVELAAEPPRADVVFWARTGTTVRRLGSAAWTLEPGESPVVLLAAAGLGDASPFDSGKAASGIAGVVLVEARTAPAE